MNQFFTRRNIIILIVAMLVTGGILWGIYALTHMEIKRSVTLNFDSSIRSVTVSGDVWICQNGSCDTEAYETKLNSSGQVSLADGIYYVTATGDTVSDEAVKITVDSSHTTFTIKPYYSDNYLATLLTKEQTALQDRIREEYPQSTQYAIDTGKLYQFGEWYATSLALPVSETNLTPDRYYVILHKTDGVWQIAGKPSLYFTYTDHKDIPVDVIKDVNAGIINTTDDGSDGEE